FARARGPDVSLAPGSVSSLSPSTASLRLRSPSPMSLRATGEEMRLCDSAAPRAIFSFRGVSFRKQSVQSAGGIRFGTARSPRARAIRPGRDVDVYPRAGVTDKTIQKQRCRNGARETVVGTVVQVRNGACDRLFVTAPERQPPEGIAYVHGMA